MAAKKIKLREETISKILVADTDSESGTVASDFEKDFEEEEEKQQQQASAEVGGQAAASGGLPTWGPPQGRNTNIDPFVSPAKGVKKSGAPHINKDSSPLSVLLLFFTEIFHLLLVRNLIEEAGKSQDRPTPRLVGRPSSAETNVVRLDSHHNQQWPAKSPSQLHC